MFDWCRHSLTTQTPVKYEIDANAKNNERVDRHTNHKKIMAFLGEVITQMHHAFDKNNHTPHLNHTSVYLIPFRYLNWGLTKSP